MTTSVFHATLCVAVMVAVHKLGVLGVRYAFFCNFAKSLYLQSLCLANFCALGNSRSLFL